jgi:Bacterial SH3 domain
MRRTLWACALLLLFAEVTAAQNATVKRNVILRAEATTASPAIEHLEPGAALTLLDPAKLGGFYHVKAEDGQTGWVWARNVSLESAAPGTNEQPSAAGTTAQCDDSLWDHVYNPQRLIVKAKCMAVTGTIVDATKGKRKDGVRHEPDGDTHGWLDVDPQFKNLLNAGNLGHEGGNLVFEVVCKFPVSQADAVASCPTSYHTPIQIPPVGSHVRIVGSYVQDNNHAKWMEIHPVTSIEVIPNAQ